jgi:hypothetical protein
VASNADVLPGTLRWAVWLLRAEAVALGGLVVAFLGLIIFGRSAESEDSQVTDLTAAILVSAFAAAAAVALWLLGTALANRRVRARAPAIVLQLMLLPIGYYMTTGGLGWLGIPLIALGLLVAGLLVSPPTTRAFGLE